MMILIATMDYKFLHVILTRYNYYTNTNTNSDDTMYIR